MVLHSARFYDLVAWAFLLGRETAFRERVLGIAGLAPGESVLDIGCGTGTLAIRATGHVGPTGSVSGIDASPEMIARAQAKARKAGVTVDFKRAVVEALPFADAQFDAVLSTLMLHHLPPALRQQCAREIRRVLKPGGRVVIVDFGARGAETKTFWGHFHAQRRVEPAEIISVLTEAGFTIDDSGAMGIRDLQFVRATSP
jgi:ubiquinone/menaquinone biosynthesis C-methylase UbiE